MRIYKLKKCKVIYGLYFTPDCTQLVVVPGIEGAAGEAVWLDLTKGEPVANLLFWREGWLGLAYVFTPDLSRLVISRSITVAAQLPELIRVCDPRSQRVKWRTRDLQLNWPDGAHLIYPYALALSQDGNRLLVGFGWQRLNQQGGVWTYHLTDCRLDTSKAPQTQEVDSRIGTVAIAPDGIRWVMSQGQDRQQSISLFDRFVGEPLVRVDVPGLRIGKPTFSPDGQYLAAINSAKTAIVMRADQLTIIGFLETNTKKHLNDFAFSPDSSKIITGAGDGSVRVWETARAKLINSFDWNVGPVTAVAFSPDGLLCAAGGKSGQIVVWDVDN
jgi:WD40 repeat protein